MSKITVSVFAVTIRRDAQTITPTFACAHELPVLRMAFGKENVSKPEPSHTYEVDMDTEFERLSAKYGGEVAVAVFGEDGVHLERVVEPQKPAKAAKVEAPAA